MKIILNIMTHGNEKMGLKVAKEIEKLHINKDVLAIQIANEKAFAVNKRYIDQDLNRSFPGKKNGNHEQGLAYNLLPIIKKADVVIDIHSTTSNLKDALIVSKMNKKIREYIKVIKPKYVLVMGATKNKDLISYAKIGIAFEYGKDKDPAALKKIVSDIKRLLGYLKVINEGVVKKNIKTRYFKVFSTVFKPKDYRLLGNIKNYHLVKRGQSYAKNGKKLLIARKDFYPILFGEKKYQDIFGFMGKKI